MRLDHLLSKESTVGQAANLAAQTADSHVDHWLFGLSQRRRLDVLSRGSEPELWLSGHHYSVLKERPPRPLLFGSAGAACTSPRRDPVRSSSTHQLLENCIASTSIFVLPSYKVPTVDALASTTDEGRVWLRKATVSCLESVTNRGCPNGETHHLSGWYSGVNT